MSSTRIPPKLDDLVEQLSKDYPHISFKASSRFVWHAGLSQINYITSTRTNAKSSWALLHETSHAILGHAYYDSDIELLHLEVDAWEKAKALASAYGITIDQEYIEDCLDTYRDWLHVRATCPICYERSLQVSQTKYQCHNCYTTWSVTRSRLCRPYRRKTSTTHG